MSKFYECWIVQLLHYSNSESIFRNLNIFGVLLVVVLGIKFAPFHECLGKLELWILQPLLL